MLTQMVFAIRPQNLFTKFYYYVIWNVNYYVTCITSRARTDKNNIFNNIWKTSLRSRRSGTNLATTQRKINRAGSRQMYSPLASRFVKLKTTSSRNAL